jgi:uncharacterized protein YndB with AHSA1/START domain
MQKPKLVYTTYIRSTPKEVWAAITKPEFTRQYWGGLDERLRLEERFEMGALSRKRSLDHRQSFGIHSAQTPRAELGRPGQTRRQIARHV